MKSCRIIGGEKGEGKSSYMLSHSEGASGFITLHRGDEYHLLDLDTGEERLLMSPLPIFSGRIGRWYFDQSLFDHANSRLSMIHGGSVLIDAVGRLEAGGGGFAPGLRELLGRDVDITISVRTPFIPLIISAFSLTDSVVVYPLHYTPGNK